MFFLMFFIVMLIISNIEVVIMRLFFAYIRIVLLVICVLGSKVNIFALERIVL